MSRSHTTEGRLQASNIGSVALLRKLAVGSQTFDAWARRRSTGEGDCRMGSTRMEVRPERRRCMER